MFKSTRTPPEDPGQKPFENHWNRSLEDPRSLDFSQGRHDQIDPDPPPENSGKRFANRRNRSPEGPRSLDFSRGRCARTCTGRGGPPGVLGHAKMHLTNFAANKNSPKPYNYGKVYDTGPPSGRGRVPGFLVVVTVFDSFPWAPGRLS